MKEWHGQRRYSFDEATSTSATPADAAIYRGSQTLDETSFAPGLLEWNKTYYWRIRGYYYLREELASGAKPDQENALGSSEETGSFTIPLMMRFGVPGAFAAAVETAASMGGLIMPPLMAVAGFADRLAQSTLSMRFYVRIRGLPYIFANFAVPTDWDAGGGVYLRSEMRGVLIGTYESAGQPWS